MKKKQVEKLIKQLVIINKAKVILALNNSGISMSQGASDKNIYETVLLELNGGNQKLLINLGLLIDSTFIENEDKSGIVGGFPVNEDDYVTNQDKTEKDETWWKRSRGKIFSTGINILDNVFGKNNGGKIDSLSPQYTNTNVGAFLANQQKASERRRLEDAQRRKEEESRRGTNMIIFVLIGSAILIGSIVAVVKFSKQKA